jgi:hypothetical protein
VRRAVPYPVRSSPLPYLELALAKKVTVSHTYLEVHGVKLDVEVAAEELVPAVEAILPPGWDPSDDFPEDGHFVVAGDADRGYEVLADGVSVGLGVPADVAIHLLDAQIRARIAATAPNHVFIHAGVVGIDGKALLLPGPSFSGKTALAAALVAVGAAYYSDEYAVLDQEGLVHPYPRPLSLRGTGDRYGTYTRVEELGGQIGDKPLKPALIAVATYTPGSQWAPARLTPSVGALRLLSNAVPARLRPEDTMRAVRAAAADAVTLEGERGEAGETAVLLLDELQRIAD